MRIERHRPRQGRFVPPIFLLAAWLIVAMLLPAMMGAQTVEPQHSGTQVKERVREILAQPEFRSDSSQDPLARLAQSVRKQMEDGWKWLQRQWDRLADWFRNLFAFSGSAAGALSYGFLYIFIGLFLLGMARLAFMIFRNQPPRTRKKTQSAALFEEDEVDEQDFARDPEVWLTECEKYTAEREYRRAFRAVFIAALLLLDRAGAVEFDRARTNGDYLRALRKKSLSQLLDGLRPLTREFDRRWYGHEPTGPEDIDMAKRAFERIKKLTEQAADSQSPAARGA